MICPISQDLMEEPVMVTVCGHSFERRYIEEWFKKEGSCPLCKKGADGSHLQRNFALGSLIEHYK